MALREKFGRLVLLEETEESPLGREYRAARLGPAGLDRLVSVVRFAPGISQDAVATKRLMDEARLAARLQSPGLQRVLGIGRVEQGFYVSTELVEGRTLAAILERCARESFPFAADHALMVASRAASALEYLHGKKDDGGAPLFHGLLAPRHLLVAFDGEVKLKGLGLWPSLRETAHLPGPERAWLAPEQAGGAGDVRSDVYSLGRVLLSSLTLRAPDGTDPVAAISDARVTATTGEAGPLPKPLGDLLHRALASDPASRYPSVAEMRKAIDTLLFSGDFTPTTFDLAFFMHTLFREEMEREGRTLEEERRADYREFLSEEKPAAAAPAPAPEPAPSSGATQPAVTVSAAAPTLAESSRPTVEQRPPTSPAPAASLDSAAAARETAKQREVATLEAASRMSLGASEPESRGAGRWIAAAAVVLAIAAAGGWFLYSRGRSAPAPAASPAALTPDAAAALQRVKELETRIAQLESEKASAESKAAEDARKKVEAQAAAKGRAVDPEALERAQEEARQRARAEQEAKQQEELRRLAEQRRAEEKRIAEASPPPSPAAAPAASGPAASAPASSAPAPGAEATPSVTATPGIVTAPPGSTAGTAPATTQAGAAATAAAPTTAAGAPAPVATPEAKLVPPAVISQVAARYPPLAQQRLLPGTVEVSALIDETGKVAEANIVRAEPKRLGFEEAALQHVRSRRYRPATRDGAPTRVWVSIVVEFRPKR